MEHNDTPRDNKPEQNTLNIPAKDEPSSGQEVPPKAGRRALGTVAVAVFVIAAVLLTVLYFIPESRYKNAAELYASGRYAEAQVAFEALGNYKDSREQVTECVNAAAYDAAEALYASGRYAEAQAAFEALGAYKDSAARAEECRNAILASDYSAAVSLMEKGRYAEAKTAFEALGDYRDSKDKATECGNEIDYIAAADLYKAGDYAAAAAAFQRLGGYKDAPEYVNKSKYAYVKLHEDSSDMLTRSYLPDLAKIGYEDSAEIFDRLLNEATMTEYTNASAADCICVSFYLLPGETVTAVLPAAEDITYTNDGRDWLKLDLEIPKQNYNPQIPLATPEYAVTPQIIISKGDVIQRTLNLYSFTLVFPPVALEITEPSLAQDNVVMCAEGNVLRIVGITADGAGITVNGTEIIPDEDGRFEAMWTLDGDAAEQVIITAYKNDHVTTSVMITALPYRAPETEPEMPAESPEMGTEPQITFMPEGSELFNDPMPVTVLGQDAILVYAGPGEDYAVLASAGFGDRLETLGTYAGWFLVEYRENSLGWLNGKYCFGGWMFATDWNPSLKNITPAENILETPRRYTLFAEAGATMLYSPDTASDALISLECGAEFVCIGYDAGWYLCYYNGVFGWINENSLA